MSAFPNGLPGLRVALTRLIGREVHMTDPSGETVVEAVNAAAARLEAIERRLDRLEKAVLRQDVDPESLG